MSPAVRPPSAASGYMPPGMPRPTYPAAHAQPQFQPVPTAPVDQKRLRGAGKGMLFHRSCIAHRSNILQGKQTHSSRSCACSSTRTRLASRRPQRYYPTLRRCSSLPQSMCQTTTAESLFLLHYRTSSKIASTAYGLCTKDIPSSQSHSTRPRIACSRPCFTLG